MPEKGANLTELLLRSRRGDREAANDAFQIAGPHLRRIARAEMRGQRRDHTLQPTALVNEACLRLLRSMPELKNRAQFYRVAGKTMRSILVDHARARRAAKRCGGWQRLEYQDDRLYLDEQDAAILAVNQALTELAESADASDRRLATVVELSYFEGFTTKQIADKFGVSPATIGRDLREAKNRLKDMLA